MFWKRKSVQEHSCCESQTTNPETAEDTCSNEGCGVPIPAGDPERCPSSGKTGLKVDLITLKALLTGPALRRLDGKQYRFCPSAECSVVYFDNQAGSVFERKDLTVKVGQKETLDPIPICYCFNLTAEDIRRELAAQGRTDIPAFITKEIKAGHCACEVRNPQGTCCLGNVAKAAKRIRAELAESMQSMGRRSV